MKSLLLLLLAAAAAAPQGAGAPTARPAAQPATAPAAEPAPAPIPLENWRFNARERTARGLAALESQNAADAVAAMDSAARLRPHDPLAAYNSGTAHLAAGLGDAEPLLERALRAAPPELASDGFYNLGNARYAAKNAAGAIDAFKETLRREPGHAGARRNLELALKLLEEQQQQQQQQQQEGGESGGEQGSEGESQQGEGEGEDESQQPDSGQGQQGEQRDTPGAPGGDPTGAGSERERPLPQFRDQEDMTAEQAAAILQAVENLERERRREDAKARARAKSSVEKDW